jgi:hypothetical protein
MPELRESRRRVIVRHRVLQTVAVDLGAAPAAPLRGLAILCGLNSALGARDPEGEKTVPATQAPRSKTLTILANVPWTFFIILYLVITTLGNIDMHGAAGYVFLGFGIVVLFLEFFKSGNIRTSVFFLDLTASVVAVIVGAVLMTYMITVMHETPTFFHWYGAVILIADAILSPYNSFRTAIRNFEFGN